MIEPDCGQQLDARVEDPVRRCVVDHELVGVVGDLVFGDELPQLLREGEVELDGLHHGSVEGAFLEVENRDHAASAL